MPKISYTTAEAAAEVGVSVETIRAAVRSGDLQVRQPEINGRQISTRLIPHAALMAWAVGDEA